MIRTSTLAAALVAGSAAAAHEYAAGDIEIGHPFIVETPAAAPVAGGYLTITNSGETDDVLVSAEVDPARAPMVQLHEMTMDDGGVMRMSEVAGGIPVPAGETVALERGGLHVMFMQLPEGFDEVGAELPATLTFRDAGAVDVVFVVEARGGPHEGPHGRSGHGD